MGEATSEIKTSAFERRGGHDCDHEYQPIGVRAQRRQRAAARAHVGLKPMRFVSLHHHSTFSSLDGFELPEAHVRRATEINMSALAMTEHGNIFSHVKLEKACEDKNVKPIFGCEVYCSNEETQKKNHLTLLAMNDEGYRNLLTLVSKSWKDGWYYEPTIKYDWLKKYNRGLICLSGCAGSALFTALVGGKFVDPVNASYVRGRKVAKYFKRIFGDRYFLEVQGFPELENTCKANPMIERLGKELGIKLVGTLDCHYTAPEHSEIQVVLHNMRGGEKRTIEAMEQAWGYDVPLCPPPTDKAIYRRLRGTGLSKSAALEAIITTEEIAQACNVVLPKLPKVDFPLPRGYDNATDLWRDWLREGWNYRGFNKLRGKERARYKAQFDKEVEVIEEKGYENYFLIVADSVKWAKNEQIPVGPARGSAAASLCCYLLRITEVNPMHYPNLVFERFIDKSRADMPDVDLDFDPEQRYKVREYLVSKYGEESVSNIGTFTGYTSRLALDDVARAHQIPKFEVETLKNLLIERSSGDLRASATIEDTVEQFPEARKVVETHPELRLAMDLEGNVKGDGVHAAGLVISNGPITDVAAVLEREVPKGSGNWMQIVSMDKKDAERQGLEKLDYLSLGTLALIAEALRMLDMPLEALYDIDLEDPKTIAGFQDNDVLGIFQYEGRATRSVCGALKPENFKEICDIGAMSRPGPLHSGAAAAYIETRKGEKEHQTLHPALDAITQDTWYQIIYQEQILRIVKEIGNFDWTHASYIRKIISKKLGKQEFNRQWSDFWEGARTIDQRTDYEPMTEPVAKRVWGECITAGAYAFNAAHSYSYGMLAVWCMWLKQHHPQVFYAASLSKTREQSAADKDNVMTRHAVLMRDAAKGRPSINRPALKLLVPHPVKSGRTWKPSGRRGLRAGFEQVSGVGEKLGPKMEEFKQGHKVRGWNDYLQVDGFGPAKVEKFAEFENSDDPFGIEALDGALESVKQQLEDGELPGLPAPTHTASEVPYERGSGDQEVIWLGMPLRRNLRDIFESHRARTGEELDPATVKAPDLHELVKFLCTDGDEQLEIKIDRFRYPRFKELVWGVNLGKDLILVQGVKKGYRSAREIEARKMWVIDPEEG